ncbi:MAG: helix-turn-helix domain-containing protein [Prolixibacteraceae bacterium]|nr:helix-turn-helix domain-containing protein [Prolixibacteraceae bacterium]
MENIIRLSVSEAAKLFGVSSKTIRLAIKEEELKYIVVKGRYKISFASLVEWSQKSTRRYKQLQKQGLGQFVDKWKIRNKKYSPSQKLIDPTDKPTG